jgi:hypothetical protein
MDFFKRILFFILTFSLLTGSCIKPEKSGTLEITFLHTIDEKPVQWNQLIYTNAAGNQYQLNEVKYFISGICLHIADSNRFRVPQDEGIHYVDCSLPNSLHWIIKDIPLMHCIGISFVFGLDALDNISNRFVNPPECNFSWPNYLGGGYHYMQINGKFINNGGNIQNMNIHTGIGQEYNENDEIINYVHNYFTVYCPVNFSIKEESITTIILNMEIQRWFDTPHLYNFDDFGAGIMKNQHAQKLLKENGWNIFTVTNNNRNINNSF